MATKQQVVNAWIDSRRGHEPAPFYKLYKSGRMSTDGTHLWSYGLLIGIHTPDGTHVRNAMAGGRRNPGGQFYSMTTSHHVSSIGAPKAWFLSDAEFERRFGHC